MFAIGKEVYDLYQGGKWRDSVIDITFWSIGAFFTKGYLKFLYNGWNLPLESDNGWNLPLERDNGWNLLLKRNNGWNLPMERAQP